MSPAALTVPCMHWTSFRREWGTQYSVLVEGVEHDLEADLLPADDGGWQLYYGGSDGEEHIADLGHFHDEGELLIAADNRLAELLEWPELAEETTLLRQ
jgi:hypothetical protein